MEQVYYTQCPAGFGLGVASGFQVKRISAGYPRSADFRHLSMRVLMAGPQVAFPASLRYRVVGETYEIARLWPRALEYEVEPAGGGALRTYGRPGGLFAHGLRLNADELEVLDCWPAGLSDWAFWVNRDPQPTAGRGLEPIVVGEELRQARPIPPRFNAVAALARGLSSEAITLLLGEAARSVRENRTLFLIDDEDGTRLASIMMWLTFAFPPRLRRQLTFSTFHDRPEGSSGFRIVGTTTRAHPDRSSLQTRGHVIELDRPKIADGASPPRWAAELAGWIVCGDGDSWQAACLELSARVPGPEREELAWSDRWLNNLILFREHLSISPGRLISSEVRRELADAATWASESGLASSWAESRDASWWLSASEYARRSDLARSLLSRQLQWAESWQHGSDAPEGLVKLARDWGETAGAWLTDRPESEVSAFLRSAFVGSPVAARRPFVLGLLRRRPEQANPVVDWLVTHAGLDPSRAMGMRLLGRIGTSGEPIEIANLIIESLGHDHDPRPGLELALEESSGRPDAVASLASAIASAWHAAGLEFEDGKAARIRTELLGWALQHPAGRPIAEAIAVEALDPAIGDPDRLYEGLSNVQRGALCTALLSAARGPRAPAGALPRAIAAVFRSPDGAKSVPELSLADAYINGFPSDWSLYRQVFDGDRLDRLVAWVRQAGRSNRLGESSRTRWNRVLAFDSLIQGTLIGDPAGQPMPTTLPDERADLFRSGLTRFGGTLVDALAWLALCRRNWAETPRGPSARALAESLAEGIELHVSEAGGKVAFASWVPAALRAATILGDPAFAAELAAATSRRERLQVGRWGFRRALLHDARTWKFLARDIRLDLDRDDAPRVFDDWDARLEVGTQRARFLEAFLNACDDREFLAIYPKLTGELRSLPTLSWWTEGGTCSLEDRRDRLATRHVASTPGPVSARLADSGSGPNVEDAQT